MNGFTEHSYHSEDGLNLYYRHYAGPTNAPLTILCIPGLTRNSRDFEELADHLASRYRVLCADLRGRGKSQYAPDPSSYNPLVYLKDIRLLLDAAEIEKAVLIGTSLGGMLAMLAAASMRARVCAAVLNDIGPVVEVSGIERIRGYVGQNAGFPSWRAAAASIRDKNRAAFPRWGEEDWMRMAHKTCAEGEDGRVRTDYDKRIAQPLQQSGSPANTDLWSVFEASRGIPTLAIRGELSDILSQQVFDEMKVRLPGLQQALVRNVGHAPFLTEPEARKAIDAFLKSLN